MNLSDLKTEELFLAALDLSSAEREIFLKHQCGSDSRLREKIHELLAADEKAEENDFLKLSAVEQDAENLAEILLSDKFIGQTVGHYKILEKIGAGGMGAIYLGMRADGHFEKRVALKFIKRGMDSETILRRFLLERRILANLEHPNIARLLDGGITDDGLPYFVMEYIEGIPITDFCGERNLSINERIELFRKVCAAVFFAHQNLIVHRDLKPSNILVTRSGEPKLLDFGIAKLLDTTESDAATQPNLRVLSPAYASPEQLRGENVTTATDVYSLGVILYELLTEHRPFLFDSQSFEEILRAVCDTEPPRPSAIITKRGNSVQTPEKDKTSPQANKQKLNLLRGDLDNIVLKALRKEPERRYSSVEQFSEDLRRHLAGFPVSARRDTFSYRAAKFAGRNKIGIAAAVIVFATLAVGIFATLRQSRIAQVERLRAEHRAENLRKISNSLIAEIHKEIEHLPGSLPARQLLLRRAVEQLDALAVDAGENLELQNEVATAYFSVGNMQQAAGNVESALESHSKAVEIYQKLIVSEPRSVSFRAQLAEGLANIGGMQKIRGDSAASLDSHRQAVELLETIVAEAPDNPRYRHNLWHAHYGGAVALYLLGRAEESLAASRRSLVLAEELRQLEPSNSDYAVLPAISRNMIANNLDYAGDYQTAIEEYRRLIAENMAEYDRQPNNTRYRYSLWAFNRRLAQSLRNSGATDDALATAQTSLDFIAGLANDSPSDAGHQRNKSVTHLLVGQILMRRGDEEKALRQFQNSIEISERLHIADPYNGETQADLAVIHSNFGNSLVSSGSFGEGLRYLRNSLKFYEKMIVSDSQNAQLKSDYARACAWLGQALAEDKNQTAEARQMLEKSFDLWSEMKIKGNLSRADFEQPEKTLNQIKRLTN